MNLKIVACLLASISFCLGENIKRPYQRHLVLPILQQEAIRSYKENLANKHSLQGSSPPGANGHHAHVHTTKAKVSPREKMSWSHDHQHEKVVRTKKFKRQDGFDGNLVLSPSDIPQSGGGQVGNGVMDSGPVPMGAEALVPQQGPYASQALIEGQDDGTSAEEMGDKKTTFRNWEEYKEAARLKSMNTFKPCPTCKPLTYTPVMDPDTHFREVDKLFRKKNERVSTFHDLNQFMKDQGKKFQFPTRRPLDMTEACADGRPPPCISGA